MKRLSVFILAGMVAAAAFGAEPAKATTERQTLQEQNTAKTAAKPEQAGEYARTADRFIALCMEGAAAV